MRGGPTVTSLLSKRYVNHCRLVWKNFCTKTELVRCALLEVQQQITERCGCCVFKCFLNGFDLSRLSLFRQMNDLQCVAGVFKHRNVMTIQADRAVFFSVVEQVLNDVYDTEVSVVAPFGEQICHTLVSFIN